MTSKVGSSFKPGNDKIKEKYIHYKLLNLLVPMKEAEFKADVESFFDARNAKIMKEYL